MSFELQPVLTGELITVRPLRPADFDELFAVAADPLLWEQHPQPDRCREEVFRAFFRDALASGGAFAVVDTRESRLIGSSRYHGYDAERREVEIGWTFLARSHWGGVYNKTLKQLMLDHAFQFVDTVVFLIGTENFRSRRAVEKLGGILAGSGQDRAGVPHVRYQIEVGNWSGGRSGAEGSGGAGGPGGAGDLS
ncbi:GNAT family N-acetyltransferase [Salinispora sp. H7-4]|uniref:GNAT family N-acetyltransferase n=1 Tax=Salinispora sp. H7-4 TaxID=2748321 RepID=UPI0015D17C5E|nr:GNAT family N-acetyltransferase [Salinispora sp. H7-4]NYT95886.1 GNAT family N-acetyltransferase [Salinispora sp. H7-4]